jgi:hypothetical protein
MKHVTAMTKTPAAAMEKQGDWDLPFILGSLQLSLTVLSALQTKKASAQ